MSIVNYADRVFKTNLPAIDVAIGQKTTPLTFTHSQDITWTRINQTYSIASNWEIESIFFTFSAATARNFTAEIVQGVRILEHYNDFLWIRCGGVLYQKITLTAGWYSGTTLATQLQTQLNANTYFAAAAITFTVSYAATTGLFTITPSSGSIQYLQTNTAQGVERNSIAGHLFGLTTDSAFAATLVSDTPVFDLDSTFPIIQQTANTSLSYQYVTPVTLTLDQAFKMSSNREPVTVSYIINYKKLQL